VNERNESSFFGDPKIIFFFIYIQSKFSHFLWFLESVLFFRKCFFPKKIFQFSIGTCCLFFLVGFSRTFFWNNKIHKKVFYFKNNNQKHNQTTITTTISINSSERSKKNHIFNLILLFGFLSHQFLEFSTHFFFKKYVFKLEINVLFDLKNLSSCLMHSFRPYFCILTHLLKPTYRRIWNCGVSNNLT